MRFILKLALLALIGFITQVVVELASICRPVMRSLESNSTAVNDDATEQHVIRTLPRCMSITQYIFGHTLPAPDGSCAIKMPYGLPNDDARTASGSGVVVINSDD